MTNDISQPSRRVLLGHISGAHGIRGLVLIKSYAAEPEDIGAYGLLEDEAATRRFEIEVEGATAKGIIARVKGIEDRTAAEKLKGVALYVARDRLPETEEGEYYHADLIGLTAVDPGGTALGSIVQVMNFGAGDILELRLSGQSGTELVPMRADVVREVDLVRGQVVIALPAVLEAEAGEEAAAGHDQHHDQTEGQTDGGKL
ncbi:MAG: ribosome maturation factor RimM [Hyphomicrobium sp.]|jgi:16S rRNA processing protein RimM